MDQIRPYVLTDKGLRAVDAMRAERKLAMPDAPLTAERLDAIRKRTEDGLAYRSYWYDSPRYSGAVFAGVSSALTVLHDDVPALLAEVARLRTLITAPDGGRIPIPLLDELHTIAAESGCHHRDAVAVVARQTIDAVRTAADEADRVDENYLITTYVRKVLDAVRTPRRLVTDPDDVWYGLPYALDAAGEIGAALCADGIHEADTACCPVRAAELAPTVQAEETAECGWDGCSEPATSWGVCVEHFDTKEQHPLVTARHARGVNCDLPRPCELHDAAPAQQLCTDKNGFHDGHDWRPDPCDDLVWCPGYPVPTAAAPDAVPAAAADRPVA